jgi:Cu(I)/Ag(I) efflux system protein CusF
MKASNLMAGLLLALAGTTLAAPSTAPLVDGEVRKVDKEQGKLTLRHGPIPNLEMGGMTMVFRVTDPKWLDSLKEGDKLSFTADRVNGVFTVTSIAPKSP